MISVLWHQSKIICYSTQASLWNLLKPGFHSSYKITRLEYKTDHSNTKTFMNINYLYLENMRPAMLRTGGSVYKVHTILFFGQSVITKMVYIWGISSNLQDLS